MYAQKHLRLGDNRLNYPVLPSTLAFKGISTFVCELGRGEFERIEGEEGISTYQVRLRPPKHPCLLGIGTFELSPDMELLEAVHEAYYLSGVIVQEYRNYLKGERSKPCHAQ